MRREALLRKGSLDVVPQCVGRGLTDRNTGCVGLAAPTAAVEDTSSCSIGMRALGQAAQLRSRVAFQGLRFLIWRQYRVLVRVGGDMYKCLVQEVVGIIFNPLFCCA